MRAVQLRSIPGREGKTTDATSNETEQERTHWSSWEIHTNNDTTLMLFNVPVVYALLARIGRVDNLHEKDNQIVAT